MTELDGDDRDTAVGLCDLGLGFAELGAVSFAEVGGLRGGLGLPVERDRWFKPAKTLGAYAEAATRSGYLRALTTHLRNCVIFVYYEAEEPFR